MPDDRHARPVSRSRARELGITIGRLPTGTHNAITDVAGVLVGHATLVSGEGPLVVGQGRVRTGVTVVRPSQTIGYGEAGRDAVFVTETWDGALSDTNGMHVKPEHVARATTTKGQQE
jgi:L-aminopeptidase/D-esterase-like protein